VGVAKGVCPLGRRAGVKVLPEKGRQRAVSGVRRASEGGKRSCSPSEELVGEKWRENHCSEQAEAAGFPWSAGRIDYRDRRLGFIG